MYIGRLGRYKGIEYLIKATEKLPYNYYTVIIGDGPKKEKLKELVQNKNLLKKYFF